MGETWVFLSLLLPQRFDPRTQAEGKREGNQGSERIGDLPQVTLSQHKASKQSTPSDPNQHFVI